ncbi:MAG: preprotein translocase subunit YajC [Endomicrobiales bacterium]|nr:preprotein translocase subunit YajC [Endomicrobiales bacterium]
MKLVSLLSAILMGPAAVFAADPVPPAQSPMGSFLPLIVIFVIFYFFLIRPQQKKAKEHQNMLNALKKDDKIITNGGLYGTIASVKGEIVEVKVADNVKVQVAKSAVATLVKSEGEAVNPEIVK